MQNTVIPSQCFSLLSCKLLLESSFYLLQYSHKMHHLNEPALKVVNQILSILAALKIYSMHLLIGKKWNNVSFSQDLKLVRIIENILRAIDFGHQKRLESLDIWNFWKWLHMIVHSSPKETQLFWSCLSFGYLCWHAKSLLGPKCIFFEKYPRARFHPYMVIFCSAGTIVLKRYTSIYIV